MVKVDDAARRLRRARQAWQRTRSVVEQAGFYGYERLTGKKQDVRAFAVVINNHNRLEWLRMQLDWLERAGMRRIIILDNGSSYAPLLKFYETTRHEVVRGPNLGPKALWKSDLWRRLRNEYYVYTDPDVVPLESCPLDAVEHFYGVLRQHPRVEKVGFGLMLDDLPDCYAKKADVLEWEAQYWREPLAENLYLARIDTTFALYRPRARGGWKLRSVRTGHPYVARHMPWYADSNNPSEEDRFYAQSAGKGMSSWLDGSGRAIDPEE